jgi:hypothetical protein
MRLFVGRSGHLSQDIILLHDNAMPHSTYQSQQPFQWNVLTMPCPSSVQAVEATLGKLTIPQ